VIKSRIIKLAVHVTPTGEGRGTFRVFVGKCERKNPNRRPRRRWVKQSCIKGMGWAGLDWTGFMRTEKDSFKCS
jgi:hypothetical protein